MLLITPNPRAVHCTNGPFELQEDECLLQKTTAIDKRLLNFLVQLFCAPHNYQHKGTVCNLREAVFWCGTVIESLSLYSRLFNLSCPCWHLYYILS